MMELIKTMLTKIVGEAFEKCGYDKNMGVVNNSDRPELCDYQCNGALQGARLYHKSPIVIANEVQAQISDNRIDVTVVNPGFININVNPSFLAEYIQQFIGSLDNLWDKKDKTVIIDFGGANVAKPLHIGHLRSAIIGESIKRIVKTLGYNVIGDAHLGDWGLQMGMVIIGIKEKFPDLVFFDENYKGEYPTTSPVTISDLETIYPSINARAKENEELMEECKKATYRLQNNDPGYTALWKAFVNISIEDLRINYANLNVEFDLWLGESDSQPLIPAMCKDLIDKGYAQKSQGAWIIPVNEESDTMEVPPFILLKSDGAALYSTTDLATIILRQQKYNASAIIYVVDNRQSMHFLQVFRTARLTNIANKDLQLDYVGFGTMNGKDGKPYKTRSGGVMKLSNLIKEIKEKAKEKLSLISEKNGDITAEEISNIIDKITVATLKFADLSNYRTKDYIFDLDKFTEFEGKTGPYLLYSVARMKSLLKKVADVSGSLVIDNKIEQDMIIELTNYVSVIENAYSDFAPSYICDYCYSIAQKFNNFYAHCNIQNEQNKDKKFTWISIVKYTLTVLEKLLDILGIDTLERM